MIFSTSDSHAAPGDSSTPEVVVSGSLGPGISINSLGEIVWSQMPPTDPSQLFSSTRGQLTTDSAGYSNAAINNLGDLVWVEYSSTYPSSYRIRGIIAGQPVVVATSQNWIGKVDLNDRGEVVWTTTDFSSSAQIFSNVRGQLTSGSFNNYDPNINNQGDIVFIRSDPQQSPPTYQVYRIPAGSSVPAAVTSDFLEHRSPIMTDSGEMIWIEQDMTAPVMTSRIVSSLRGALLPSANNIWALDANNCGDLAYVGYNNGQTTIYRLGNSAPCTTYPGAGSTPALAEPVSFGAIFTGLLDSAVNPVSWYSFDAVNGNNIHITVNFDNRPPNIINIGLYDGLGNLLSNQTRTTPLGISTCATYSGTYYLKIEGVGGRFGYSVSFSEYTNNCGVGPCPEVVASGISGPGVSINSLGEIVWSQMPPTGPSQLFSSTRGQLTTDSAGYNTAAINNLGDLVWVEYSSTYPYNYRILGIIAGQPVVVATSQSWFGKVDLNDRGEVVWTTTDSSGYGQVYSNIRGQLTSGSFSNYDPSINNQGDIVFSRYNPQQSPPTYQVYRIPPGSTVATAVTSDSLEHRSPIMTDSGEMIWIEQDMTAPVMTSRIVSSIRGTLLPSVNNIMALDANSCGDLAYMGNNNGQTTVYRLGNSAPCATYPGAGSTPVLAAPVSFGVIFTGLVDSAANPVSWYSFDASTGNNIHITVNFDNRPPNAINIGLYDGLGNLLSNPTRSTPLGISTHATYSGTHYLKIEGVSGRFGYSVSLSEYTNNCGVGPCPEVVASGMIYSGVSINSLGEIVWSQSLTGSSQLFSSTRGQLTTDSVGYSNAAINNLGDLVWVEYSSTYPYSYRIRGIIAGQPVVVATSQNWIGKVDLNDRGEVVWTTPDSSSYGQVHSNIRGQLTSGSFNNYDPSINNHGDIVFNRNNPQQSPSTYQVYRILPGSTVPAAVTSDSLDHRSPIMTDSGEMIWIEQDMTAPVMTSRIVSSIRGTLLPSVNNIMALDANSCGDLAYMGNNNGQTTIYRLGNAAPCINSSTPTAPVVVTDVPSFVTNSFATLNGRVSDGGADTTVTFEFGRDITYGTSVSAGTVTANSGFTSVSAVISGLACGTSYHYRIAATNSIGTASGNDSVLSTPPCLMAPTVSTGSATAISTTGATLNGMVYSTGEVAVVTFDYGQTTVYDSSVVVTNSGNGEVSIAVTGLACGTTYHYRITGQNSAGISNGQDSFFTTTACPPPGSAIISTIAGNGTMGFAGDGGPAISAGFYYPNDVATDSSGNIFIADTHNFRIRKLSIDTGNISTVAGTGTSGFNGEGNLATDSKINGSYGVSVDGAGNIYIADTYNNRIRRVDAATGVITTVAGNGVAAFSGDGGPATSASLNNPHKVVLDSVGNIYIADTYNHRIRMVDAATGIISTVAGNGTAAFAGDGGVATSASFYWPYSVAVDNSGNLYIADYLNLRIRKVEKTTGIISTVAGKSGTGLITFSGEGGPATSAQISTPYGVTVDIAGNIYIAASYRVLKVDAITGILNTVAGNGVGDFSGDGGLATAANLNAPSGITIDAAGNLIIADTRNHRIRKVVAPDLTITMTSGANGSISGPATVTYGGSVMYMITPAAGYHVADVLVDDASVGPVTSFTFTNVTANHTISASFAINSYNITATAGANGSIAGPTTVNYGESASYSITPETGYHVADVLIDGASVGPVTSYTFNNVTANHTVSASFAINSYSITATAGANGSIAGPTTVNYGGSARYSVTPATGYHVADMLVDGASVGPVTSYTFNNITVNHAISASFAINSYSITATTGSNGSISGPATVNYGGSASYIIEPANGYRVANVLVDGASVGAGTSYTFTNVTASHTISATFAALADLTVNSITGPRYATRGKSISVSSSIKNQGGGAAGSFTVSFYLSKDAGITSSDTLLGTKTVTSLSSGSTTSLSGSFTVPRTIATGKYFIGVIVDSGASIIESNEANNSKAAANTTEVK